MCLLLPVTLTIVQEPKVCHLAMVSLLGGLPFSHRIGLTHRVGPFFNYAQFHAQPFSAYLIDDDERLKQMVKD
ncbi:hypothetical protein CC2G_015040 [Coprinopsis cinerea AmutBmut pab1-1]|nr:hypothetical protein CC2G_015040 [Coprinopsis cinerea AmutBmut pab1-1]